MISERTRNLYDGRGSRQFRVSEIGAGSGELPRVGGYKEETRARIRRDALAEDEGIFVFWRPVNELIGRGRPQSVRPKVGEGHLDAGRWWKPDGDGFGETAERGAPGKYAVIEIEQAGDVRPNDPELNLNGDGGAYSE